MKTPARSAAIARALASQPVELPEDFAAQVAAIAESQARVRFWRWSELALLGAFVAMIGVCVAGWSRFAPSQAVSAEWLAQFAGVLAGQPWIVIGVAGLAVIQAFSFGKRARI